MLYVSSTSSDRLASKTLVGRLDCAVAVDINLDDSWGGPGEHIADSVVVALGNNPRLRRAFAILAKGQCVHDISKEFISKEFQP